MNIQPLVSCIMPTADRCRFVSRAISYFQAQDYPNKELLVLDDGKQNNPELAQDDGQIRYLRLDQKSALGAKRNLACTEARGDIIVHWDDDDWMASWRLSYQVRALIENNAAVCGLDKLYFYEPVSDQAWQYVYPDRARFWVAGATLCYLKSFWRENPFPNINVGEDTRFVWGGRARKMIALPDASFYVAMIHSGNTSRKRTSDARYRPVPAEQIRQMMGADFEDHARLFCKP
ncbi:MAG TPA: glycosyltransferase family 2 protein [Blastocatellia bacterium]|nr:glycosyltransferase family 2 protein [Blastocatellia bacterium]